MEALGARDTHERGHHLRPGFAEGLHRLEDVYHVFRLRAFQKVQQGAEHSRLLRPISTEGRKGKNTVSAFRGDETVD